MSSPGKEVEMDDSIKKIKSPSVFNSAEEQPLKPMKASAFNEADEQPLKPMKANAYSEADE